MATLSAVLHAGFLPRLGQEPACVGGFQGWLVRSSYQPTQAQAEGEILLSRANLAEMVPYVCYDFERFSLASRETLGVYREEFVAKRIPNWPLLKIYYSAFFAAHAIMRGRGTGVVKLTREHTQHVNAVCSTFLGGHQPIQPGMFRYMTKRTEILGEVEVTIVPAPSGHGVHESFWVMFCDYINSEANLAVQNGMADSAEFVAGVTEISQAIRVGGHGSSAWLSSIRNEINYQHMHEAWFPYKKSSAALAALDQPPVMTSNSIRLDYSKSKNTVRSFFNLCYFLALLNVEIGNLVAARSTSGRAFGSKWRKLENLK